MMRCTLKDVAGHKLFRVIIPQQGVDMDNLKSIVTFHSGQKDALWVNFLKNKLIVYFLIQRKHMINRIGLSYGTFYVNMELAPCSKSNL